MSKPMRVLMVGHRTVGFQLGTGVLSGWAFMDKEAADKLHWFNADLICEECGEILEYAKVPVPYTLLLFRCKNDHRFYYENTD